MSELPPPMGPFEPLGEDAKHILATLLTAAFPGRDEVASQEAVARARPFDEHGCLELSARDALPAEVVRTIPVEAETEDTDGTTIHILLHVVDHYIDEPEFFREDGGPLQGPIRSGSLRVIVL